MNSGKKWRSAVLLYLNIIKSENWTALQLIFRKLFESTQNLQLNNTFKIYQHLSLRIYRTVWLASPLVAVIYVAWESKGSELESSFRRFQEFDVHFFAIRVFFRLFSFHFKIHEVMANMSNSAHDNFYVE